MQELFLFSDENTWNMCVIVYNISISRKAVMSMRRVFDRLALSLVTNALTLQNKEQHF